MHIYLVSLDSRPKHRIWQDELKALCSRSWEGDNGSVFIAVHRCLETNLQMERIYGRSREPGADGDLVIRI